MRGLALAASTPSELLRSSPPHKGEQAGHTHTAHFVRLHPEGRRLGTLHTP
jgi:hypothetical protein